MIKSPVLPRKSKEFSGTSLKVSKILDAKKRKSMVYQTSPIHVKIHADHEIVKPVFKQQSLIFQAQKETKVTPTISNSYSEPNIKSSVRTPLRFQRSLGSLDHDTQKESHFSKKKRRSCSIDVSWLPNEASNDNLIRNNSADHNYANDENNSNESYELEEFKSENEQMSPLCIYNVNE